MGKRFGRRRGKEQEDSQKWMSEDGDEFGRIMSEDEPAFPEEKGRKPERGRQGSLIGMETRAGDETFSKSGFAESAKRRRGMMAAMLTVVGLAGGILVLVIVQSVQTHRQLTVQQSKDARMEQQLEEIQGYLSALDQSVASGQVTDTESYEELSSTVQTLKGNLENYRDSHTIENDTIGQNLDGVISELAAIQENIEAGRAAQEGMNGELTTDVASSVNNSIGRSSEEISASIDQQVSDVREDIRELIREAAADHEESSEQLLTILDGTDSDLSELTAAVRADNEEMQNTLSAGFNDLDAGVSGVRSSIAGVQERLADVQSDSDLLRSSLEQLQASQEGGNEQTQETLTTVQDSLRQMDLDSEALEENLNALERYLSSDNSGMPLIAGKADTIQSGLQAVNDDINEVLNYLDELSEQQSEQGLDIGNMASDIDLLTASLTRLESGLSDHEKSLMELGTRLTSLAEETVKSQEMNNRFDTLDSSAASLSASLGNLESYAARMETRLNDLEDDLQKLASDPDAAGEKLAELSETVSGIRSDLDHMEQNRTELNSRIDAVDQQLAGITASLNNLEEKLDRSGTQQPGETADSDSEEAAPAGNQ